MRKKQQHDNNSIDVQSKRFFLNCLLLFPQVSWFVSVCCFFLVLLFLFQFVCCCQCLLFVVVFSRNYVTGVLDRCIKNAFVVTGGFASSVHSFRSIEADNVSKHNGQLKITSPTMQPKKRRQMKIQARNCKTKRIAASNQQQNHVNRKTKQNNS